MNNEFAPTKANLLKIKSSLEFCENGFELLDKKRNILIREIMSMVSDAEKVQNDIHMELKKGYKALQTVNLTMGINSVEEVAKSISKTENFNILYKSVMGVEIPIIDYKEKKLTPSYGFYRTNAAFDNVVMHFRKVKYLVYLYAQLETSIYKLAIEIRKTQKRANALDNIIIPKYKSGYKSIKEFLEEKDREDFFRLKRVKSKVK